MAVKKFKYSIDTTTIPKTFAPTGGEAQDIHGVFIYDKPRSLFCECGQQFRAEERKEAQPSWDGFVCPNCGHTFTTTDVLYVGWGGTRFSEPVYKQDKIIMKGYRYTKRIDVSTNVISLVKEADINYDAHYPLNDLEIIWLGKPILQKVLAKYKSSLDKYMCRVIELVLTDEIKIVHPRVQNSQPGFLRFVCETYDTNPSVLQEALNEIMTDSKSYFCPNLTYGQYESYYPEYLRPLTPKVVREAKLYYKAQNSYSFSQLSMDGLPASVLMSERQGLNLVVSYYQSGLISYDQFNELIKYKRVFANPKFERAFKSYYMQMGTFLYDLNKAQKDLATDNLDIRNYYIEKNMNPFINFGYTTEQVYDAVNASDGDYLEFLIKIGSTRRQKGATATVD